MLSDLKEFLDKQEDSSVLFSDIESIIGKPLNGTLIQDIIMLQEQYEFDNDRIRELFGLLKEKGSYRTNYIIKVADTWKKSDIATVEQSKTHETERINSIPEGLLAVFGAFNILPRVPEDYEYEYYATWTDEWDMELPLIIEACKIALNKTNTPSFSYVNAIIKNWKSSGIKTLSGYKSFREQEQEKYQERTERKKKNNFHNFSERTYDYNELMKIVAK